MQEALKPGYYVRSLQRWLKTPVRGWDGPRSLQLASTIVRAERAMDPKAHVVRVRANGVKEIIPVE